MRFSVFSVIMILAGFVFIGGLVYLFVCIIRALVKYIHSRDVREEKRATRTSLGEVIKSHREQCRMTQEFVADALGVSRQAVSKWENGAADPSTSNLIALAKLFHITPEELLKEVG